MIETAGQISNKIAKDTTKYNALEVGHAICHDIGKQLRTAIDNHKNIIAEKEFCVVYILAKDPLIHNVMRRKFYCWPYLPKPRPNQSVFLYNRAKDDITKRLWVLPNAQVMAELASLNHVHKRYQTMQAWSVAFFKGTFWDYIRYEHNIDMLSEHEYFLANREELIKAGCQYSPTMSPEPFDFSKIHIKKSVDPVISKV